MSPLRKSWINAPKVLQHELGSAELLIFAEVNGATKAITLELLTEMIINQLHQNMHSKADKAVKDYISKTDPMDFMVTKLKLTDNAK